MSTNMPLSGTMNKREYLRLNQPGLVGEQIAGYWKDGQYHGRKFNPATYTIPEGATFKTSSKKPELERIIKADNQKTNFYKNADGTVFEKVYNPLGSEAKPLSKANGAGLHRIGEGDAIKYIDGDGIQFKRLAQDKQSLFKRHYGQIDNAGKLVTNGKTASRLRWGRIGGAAALGIGALWGISSLFSRNKDQAAQ